MTLALKEARVHGTLLKFYWSVIITCFTLVEQFKLASRKWGNVQHYIAENLEQTERFGHPVGPCVLTEIISLNNKIIQHKEYRDRGKKCLKSPYILKELSDIFI